MRRDQIIKLIPVIKNENDIGDTITVKGVARKVFATKKSIRQSEFYQAAVTNFKPEITFIIWLHEYHGETVLNYSGKNYNIIRTYEKDQKEIELICEGLTNDG